MRRIRLTDCLKFAKVIISGNYSNFRVNLLKLYPNLKKCVDRFGLEGGLQGSKLVLHHLDLSTIHYIPSCTKYTNLVNSINNDKEEYSKDLNKLLRLKSYVDSMDLRIRAKEIDEFKNMPDTEFRSMIKKMRYLDAEIENMVLIPEGFHTYLHSKSREGTITLPSTMDECFKMYDMYLEDLARDEQVKVYEEKIETIRGNLETIDEISRALKTKCKDKVLGYLKPCSKKLINLLKTQKPKNLPKQM